MLKFESSEEKEARETKRLFELDFHLIPSSSETNDHIFSDKDYDQITNQEKKEKH